MRNEKTTFYSAIEKVVYEFTPSEVLDSLIKRLGADSEDTWSIDYEDDFKDKDDDVPSGWHIVLEHIMAKPLDKKEGAK